ncbi:MULTISPECIES: hypothetical protein [unclassified Sutcliffiella]|uniref:hypothetical protein n=1 Tax=unclassified Sutcliffiella TaxID=2837532 RepID=UPI0030D304AE
MDVEQSLLAVREVYVNAPRRVQHIEESLRSVEEEIQDILHVIELGRFNASDGYKLAKELQNARIERRKLKDALELLKPIKDLMTFTKPTESNIGKVLGDLRNIKKRHQNRGYRMRKRSDLEQMIKK